MGSSSSIAKRPRAQKSIDVSDISALQQAAESGDRHAQVRWALHLINHDPEQRLQAISYLEISACRGVPSAHYLLGRLNEQGMIGGIRRNITQALVHYAIAARRGHVIAGRRWQWLMALEGILWSRASKR